MRIVCNKAGHSKAFLRLWVLTFVLYSILPFYLTVNSASADGYTTVICTQNGSQTVFVQFEESSNKQNDEKSCLEARRKSRTVFSAVGLVVFRFVIIKFS
jgi:hypothetical protein